MQEYLTGSPWPASKITNLMAVRQKAESDPSIYAAWGHYKLCLHKILYIIHCYIFFFCDGTTYIFTHPNMERELDMLVFFKYFALTRSLLAATVAVW